MKFVIQVLILLALVAWTPARAQSNLVDTDGDGLPDLWETQGVTVNGVFVNLPAMGANPLHKDLFVEADYMVGADHTHQPKPQALQLVIQGFALAPVPNPDGINGITLHVDAGPNSIMDPVRGTRWGNLSRSDNVGHVDNLGTGNYDYTQFVQVRNQFFSPERFLIFRWCLFAHNMSPQAGSQSGVADGIPGFSSLVSLGSFRGQVGTVLEQAGTFMHEVGHTLGLSHGGDVDTGYKPNYLSVMNYSFQFNGLRLNGQDGFMDFSRFLLPPLNENNLNESLGISGGQSQSPNAIFGTRWPFRNPATGQTEAVTNDATQVDWNQNGFVDTSLAQDINGDGQFTILTGSNDWNRIVYAPVNVTPRVEYQVAANPHFQEADQTLEAQIPLDYNPDIEVANDLQAAGPGQTVSYTLTVSNQGSKPDTYTLNTTSSQGWADFSGLPGQVSLNPQQTMTYTFKVKVPAQASGSDLSEVLAISQANPHMLDEAEALTTVGQNSQNSGPSTFNNFIGGSSGSGGCSALVPPGPWGRRKGPGDHEILFWGLVFLLAWRHISRRVGRPSLRPLTVG